jgi:predicted MFS family arabinose efflux permease
MSQAAARPLPGAWYALALVAATQAISLLDRNILAILAPAIKTDLKIGDAEMGLLYGTVFALFYALFSLPLGRLVDGWIRTRLLSICILAWSAFAGLSAFASSFAVLGLSRLGVGVGEAAAQPGTTGCRCASAVGPGPGGNSVRCHEGDLGRHRDPRTLDSGPRRNRRGHRPTA